MASRLAGSPPEAPAWYSCQRTEGQSWCVPKHSRPVHLCRHYLFSFVQGEFAFQKSDPAAGVKSGWERDGRERAQEISVFFRGIKMSFYSNLLRRRLCKWPGCRHPAPSGFFQLLVHSGFHSPYFVGHFQSYRHVAAKLFYCKPPESHHIAVFDLVYIYKALDRNYRLCSPHTQGTQLQW